MLRMLSGMLPVIQQLPAGQQQPLLLHSAAQKLLLSCPEASVDAAVAAGCLLQLLSALRCTSGMHHLQAW
jgi:hypothetical protein